MLTDHIPWKAIFDQPSPHLQRLREKVAAYSFTVRWVFRKIHLIADALLRAPHFAQAEMPSLDIDTAVTCMSDTHDPSLALDIILDLIDSDYYQLIKDIKHNTSLSTYQKLLKSERENLSLEDQLVLLHSRCIILPMYTYV